MPVGIFPKNQQSYYRHSYDDAETGENCASDAKNASERDFLRRPQKKTLSFDAHWSWVQLFSGFFSEKKFEVPEILGKSRKILFYCSY